MMPPKSSTTGANTRSKPKTPPTASVSTASSTPPASSRPQRLPFTATLTPTMQKYVGAPIGKINALNPQGYSHRQQTLIKGLSTVPGPVSLASVSTVQFVSGPASSEPSSTVSYTTQPDYTLWTHPHLNGFTAEGVADPVPIRLNLKYLEVTDAQRTVMSSKRTSADLSHTSKSYLPKKYKRQHDLMNLSPFVLNNIVNDFAPSTSSTRALAAAIFHIESFYSVDNRTLHTYDRRDPTLSLEPSAWLTTHCHRNIPMEFHSSIHTMS